MRPAFAKDGTVTAASSSSISDGAASLLLMTENKAAELGLKPLAKIVGQAEHAHEPEWFTTAPVGAMQKLLAITGWSVNDVDLFEINEAFACVTMAAMHDLNLDHSKVNVNGGACALGHPIGASGARIIVTLLHALINRDLNRGIASLCIGGGEAVAIAIERTK
jgi:acetyl-CoA C-acetyltransferase